MIVNMIAIEMSNTVQIAYTEMSIPEHLANVMFHSFRRLPLGSIVVRAGGGSSIPIASLSNPRLTAPPAGKAARP